MQPGQIIADEFMLQRLLSDGADGETWRALELKVGRLVRLRFIPAAFAADAEAMRKLRELIEQLRSFRHPHVVPVERLVEPADGGPLTVERIVEGPLLDEYAAQWSRIEGKFPFRLVFDVLRPVASLLDQAHAENIVHRTLSTRHIVVSQTEGVQTTDFAVAGLLEEFAFSSDRELAFQDTDRFRYFAPEQIEDFSVKDPASDRYAFATIVAELLLGRHPFDAESPGEFRKNILDVPPPTLPGVSDNVNAALRKGLEKNPAKRFSTCSGFLDAMDGKGGETLADSTESRPIPAIEVQEISIPEISTAPPEPVVSFDKISTDAQQATAEKIAGKIHKERRFQKLFYIWNFLVLLGCVIAVIVFWDHLGGRHRAPRNNGNTEFSDDDASLGRSASRNRSTRRERSPRKEKDPVFTDSSESAFAKFGDETDREDEVRFLGTSGFGKRIVFVVDASTVMGKGKRSTWAHALKELAFSFEDLNKTQRFQVVYFNEEPHLLPGGSETEQWISASAETKKAAHDFLKGIQTSGKSNPAEALKKAMSLRPDVVFLLVDQRTPPVTFSDIEEIRKTGLADTPIHAVEIGEGEAAPRKTPAQTLAESTRGEYKWINGNLHGLK